MQSVSGGGHFGGGMFIWPHGLHVDREGNGRSKPQQRIDVRTGLKLLILQGDYQNPKPAIAGDERDGDGGLFGNAIRIVRLLAEILDECRRLCCPGSPHRAALDRCEKTLHRCAATVGGHP